MIVCESLTKTHILFAAYKEASYTDSMYNAFVVSWLTHTHMPHQISSLPLDTAGKLIEIRIERWGKKEALQRP